MSATYPQRSPTDQLTKPQIEVGNETANCVKYRFFYLFNKSFTAFSSASSLRRKSVLAVLSAPTS